MTPPKKNQAFEINTDEGVTWKDHVKFWFTGWRLRAVAVLLCLAATLAWKGPDWYWQIKLERARKLISKAEEARARGDAIEGAKLLGQATALLGRHPLTLRAVARYQAERHDLAALNIYEQLAAGTGATLEDKVAFAREAFRFAQPSRAEKVLDELIGNPSTSKRGDVLALKAQRLAMAGQWREALTVARQAIERTEEGANGYEALVLAQVLLRLPAEIPDARLLHREGIDVLGKLCQGKDATALDAAALLIDASHRVEAAELFRGRNAVPWVEAISANPLAGAGLRVRAWDLRMGCAPEDVRNIVREVHARFHNAASAERLEAARWLNQHGEHALALHLSEPSKLESEEWFMVYLDATAATGRWEEVRGLLTDSRSASLLPAALRKLFQLRTKLEMRQPVDTAAAWRDIQLDLRHETSAIQLYVAGYAQQTGFPQEAAQIYRRLLDAGRAASDVQRQMSRPQRMMCHAALVNIESGARTTEELCALVAAFANEFPELDEVRNDLAYLELLMGQNVDAACDTAKALTLKRPEMLAYRSTLALGELRSQRIDAAAKVYEGWSIDWSTAQDRFKAVHVAVLAASGNETAANKLRPSINPSQLRPEEKVLAGMP
jgi:hypothetical protein